MSYSPETYQKDKKELEEQKQFAEANLDGEKVGELEKALQDLDAAKLAFENKTQNVGNPTEAQINQIEESGGNKGVLEEKLEDKNMGAQATIIEANNEVQEKILGNSDLEKAPAMNEGVLKNLKLSLHLNKEFIKSDVYKNLQEKQVRISPVEDPLGPLLVLDEETKMLQSLEAKAVALPEGDEKKTAWNDFRAFSDKCHDMGAEVALMISGGSLVLLPKTNQDTDLKKNLQGTTSLRDIMEGAIRDKEIKINNFKPDQTTETAPEENFEKMNIEDLKAKIKQSKEELAESQATNLAEKAKIYESLGRLEEAKQALETDAKSNEASGYYDWAADSYAKLGNQEKAKELYEKKIASLQKDILSGGSRGAYNLIGSIYEKIGDMVRSREAYQKLVGEFEKGGSKIEPEVAAAAYEKLGDTEKAKTAWEDDAKRWGESKADRAALRYEKAGNKEKSEEFYKKAIAYQEGLKEPNAIILAKSYAGLGDKQKAIAVLKAEAEKLSVDGKIGNGSFYYQEMEKYLE